MPDNPLIWLGSSRRDLSGVPGSRTAAGWFPAAACPAGTGSGRLEAHADNRTGVREIRIHVAGARRVFYLATRAEAIYVLHAFEKKTHKTTAHDLQIGRDRFSALGK